jgi:hypothetical protein
MEKVEAVPVGQYKGHTVYLCGGMYVVVFTTHSPSIEAARREIDRICQETK